MDDSELLKQYLDAGSAGAFSQLMSRHLNLVYAAARRQVLDPHLADDVTQAVFLLLAKKAHKVHGGAGLPGWLLITTHYVARHARKLEARRRINEHKAAQMAESLGRNKKDTTWEDVFPDLDAALARLSPKDRSIVALHFMEGRTFREVGHTLGMSEDAARLASARAVLKLRQNLNKKTGAALSSAALAALIATNGTLTAPANLARALTANTIGTTKASITALLLAKKTAASLNFKAAIGGTLISATLLLGASLTTLAIFHSTHFSHNIIAAGNTLPPSTGNLSATLETGGSLDLIAVAKLPLISNSWWKDNTQWWSPTGEPLPASFHPPHIPQLIDVNHESRQTYVLAFRASGMKVNPASLTAFATGEPDGCSGSILQSKDDILYATALVYPEQVATNICVRVIDAPFEDITINKDGSPRTDVSSTARSFFPVRIGERNKQAYITIHAGTYTYEYLAAAMSRDGVKFSPSTWAPHFIGQEGDNSANNVVFFDTPQSNIDYYQLSLRKTREWITFRHVSLREGNATAPFAENHYQLFEPALVTYDRAVKDLYDRIVMLIKKNDSETAYKLCLQLSDELKSRQVAVRGTDDAYLVDEGEPILAQLQQALSQNDLSTALSLVDSGNGNGHRICHMVYMLAGIPKSDPAAQ